MAGVISHLTGISDSTSRTGLNYTWTMHHRVLEDRSFQRISGVEHSANMPFGEPSHFFSNGKQARPKGPVIRALSHHFHHFLIGIH